MPPRDRALPYWKMEKIAKEIRVDWRTIRKVIDGQRVRGSVSEHVREELQRRGIVAAEIDEDDE